MVKVAQSAERPTAGAVDLRAARERKGLSLEQIAANTRIPRSLLVALEQKDFRRFPAGIYARAYTRTYAAAVGLSPDAAPAAFAGRLPAAATLRHITAPSPDAAQRVPRRIGRGRARPARHSLLP